MALDSVRWYSRNNVIVDRPIVLNSSCNAGDRPCRLQDRACIKKKITQVTRGTKDNFKQARLCLQQWIQVILLRPAKQLFHTKIWLTLGKINHILLRLIRENHHGITKG